MFHDETLEAVTVESQWKKSQLGTLHTKSCQSTPVHTAEASVQTAFTTDGDAQTDEQTHQNHQQNWDQPPPPGLLDFLQKVEDKVVRELVKNAKSHAFDGFQANWEDHSTGVSRLHCLQYPSAQEQGFHVTSVSWSCTGSVVACAYGRTDDGDWSTERSCVCLWNLEQRGLQSNQPNLIIDAPSAVTALCCHPNHPALIAGGLYNGEVVVWNTSQTQDPVWAQTGMSSDSHREPVYQVAWVPLQKKGDFGILSACSGGRVLLWLVDSYRTRLVLNDGYALAKQQIPHSISVGLKGRGSNTVGVTSLALSPWDSDTFLVGSEGGLQLKCSFSSRMLAAVPSEGLSVALKAPAVFAFRPHSGPVYSLHCSPFHRNLFVSAGTDGLAHIHSLLQADPLLSLRVSDSYVFQVQWSPTRPLVFAAASGQGDVQIFDLGRRSLRPAASIQDGGADHAATCLDFNRHRPRVLAVGKTNGTVSIWQLSDDLVEQKPRECTQLEQIANQGAE
ncbi:WD repeat-containing protein 34 [Oryzias latipes]|uniref:WD repeat-containing protein 34 n=1 Tax=Oryzias latipes TaxID=8090 RepID=UPI0000E9C17B|nr:WD repeat-containing protein 34 [Oryzias latipes]